MPLPHALGFRPAERHAAAPHTRSSHRSLEPSQHNNSHAQDAVPGDKVRVGNLVQVPHDVGSRSEDGQHEEEVDGLVDRQSRCLLRRSVPQCALAG